MTGEDYRRAKEIFLEADAAPEGERAATLERLCAGDAGLRREVEALLASAEAGAGFLDLPPDAGVPEEPDETPPSRVGPYRIVAEIGRGGMGSVFLAERADDAYAGRVAVKLVRRGLDTEDVLRRFRTERQILASLAHPNIARLLDGGTTADGRPYFVMEHIEGRTLLEDARARGLGPKERLDAFRVVCAAVQYAHRNLVVHRDLKPSNVMVTTDGVVKLLDFGLAKVLGPEASGRTAGATAIFTPEYASPEQLAGGPITTATDVYSLGVMLYELLSDDHPYRGAAASPASLWRAVCEIDPPPPSVAAARTGGPAGRRAPALAGDLDAIVLKAMRKEPARRYATVEQLSEDLGRHLDGLPVEARPESTAYRLGKFLGRHRMAAGTAAAAVLSLAAGLGVALREAHVAREHEAVARKRLEDVRALANTLLFELNESLAPVPGTTKARELLVRRGLEYLQRLDARSGPEDLALQRDVAAAYQRLADLQGGGNASLGDTDGARESLRKAIALRERTVASPAATVDDRLALASARAALADTLAPKSDEALRLTAGAVSVGEEALASAPSDRRVRRRLAILLDAHAGVLAERGAFAEALAAREREAEIFDALAAAADATDNDRRNAALAARYRASLLDRLGRAGEAESQLRKALATDEARLGAAPASAEARVDAANDLRLLGGLLRRAGRAAEALPLAERGLALASEIAAKDPANVSAQLAAVRARIELAKTLTESGRPREARAAVRDERSRLEALGASGTARRAAAEETASLLVTLGQAWEAEMGAARGAARAAARREAAASYAEAERTYAGLERSAPLGPTASRLRVLAAERTAALASGS